MHRHMTVKQNNESKHVKSSVGLRVSIRNYVQISRQANFYHALMDNDHL